jgi:isoprenylcysteine carboxyl methyltransferase (ICMT) family protein YpbQ
MSSLTESLARRRVTLGFVFGALALWLAQPTVRTLSAGLAVAGLGEALRIWAAGHLNKSREVTTSGPYQWFAHPLYIGSSIMGAGLAISSGSFAVVMLVALYLALTITAAIRREEAFLRRTFGARYESYRSGSPGGTEAAPRRFSAALAIANREHRAALGLAAAVLLLLLKATYNGSLWREGG